MSNKIVPVIMAGGKGTRLWPLSRSAAPKQFIKLIGNHTLFQNTLLRVSDAELHEPAIVITNEEFRFLAAEQAREVGVSLGAIVLEPIARNTAAAVAVAGIISAKLSSEEAIVQVLASDHEILVDHSYIQARSRAFKAARTGKLVTFGIAPTEPATGYGYIEGGAELFEGVLTVKRFVEKPQRQRALEMMSHGGFFWNSGMFMFTISTLLTEMSQHAPDVLEISKSAIASAVEDLDFTRLDAEIFAKNPDISFDCAVMEKTSNAVVVPSVFPWSDLGSWDAVWKTSRRDENQNVTSTNTTILNTKNSLVMTSGTHVAVQGLEEIAVVVSEDAVYVGRLEDSQEVAKIVQGLNGSPVTSRLAATHLASYRPWGGFTSVFSGDRFHVRRVFVSPGKELSLHMHHHRAEHWIVVKGTAEFVVGDLIRTLPENESVYIPAGEIHGVANRGKITLELIEVQTGSYLGEDDIVRVANK